MKKRRKMMMKKNRQLWLKPRCVILLSTQTAESAAAEAPKVRAAVSTAWCRTLGWKLHAHAHEAPTLVQRGACYHAAGGLRGELFSWGIYTSGTEKRVSAAVFLFASKKRTNMTNKRKSKCLLSVFPTL